MTQPELPHPSRPRILMVDDHPIVREGMAQLLNQQGEFHLCCQASNAHEAFATMAACRHAMAIVDISLGTESGLDLIKELRHLHPDLAILAMSMHDESLFAERALKAGAKGYLMKQAATGNIIYAVKEIIAGNIYLSPSMLGKMTKNLLTPPGAKTVDTPINRLSQREFEILHLLGLGFGTRQIAQKLGRSIKTVETHYANIKGKLQVKSGRDLNTLAVQLISSNSIEPGRLGESPIDY